ncbi:MAG: sodium:calcium antiporter [Candidatus Micrarchaeota archaeon]
MVFDQLAILVISVMVLAKSSSLVVEKIALISKFFRISQIAIGFLFLATATSLPELSVSVTSSAVGEGAIAAGNVFGSNIANILLVLGAGAFLFGVRINRHNLSEIGLVLLLTTVISAYIVFNSSIQQQVLGFFEGMVLLGIFGIYVWYSLRKKRLDDGNGTAITKREALEAFILFGAGIVIVITSSGFVVSSAVHLAQALGIAESFIGATIIAVGTSLPELSIDLQAIKKRKYGIALGDAIGSNMTNITLVLGTAAAINPIEVRLPVFIAALLFAVIANTLLLYLSAVNRKMQRLSGALLLLIYAIYIAVIFGLQFRELGG